MVAAPGTRSGWRIGIPVILAALAGWSSPATADSPDSKNPEITEAVEATGLGGVVSIPPFTFWRRRDLSSGKSPFDRFRVNNRGVESKASGSLAHRVPWERHRGDWRELLPDDYGRPHVSPSKHWSATVTAIESADAEDSSRCFVLHLAEVESGRRINLPIPPMGWGTEPMSWHGRRDMYFFNASVGPSNCRGMFFGYVEVSQAARLYSIGTGGAEMNISPDGRWLVWENGECRQDNEEGGPTFPNVLFIYDFETHTNYPITDRGGECHFDRWTKR